jgi:hypothetical protein
MDEYFTQLIVSALEQLSEAVGAAFVLIVFKVRPNDRRKFKTYLVHIIKLQA